MYLTKYLDTQKVKPYTETDTQNKQHRDPHQKYGVGTVRKYKITGGGGRPILSTDKRYIDKLIKKDGPINVFAPLSYLQTFPFSQEYRSNQGDRLIY